MQYIGISIAPDVPSAELKEAALASACFAQLTTQCFTVQMLLITSIATHCEFDFEKGRAFLDRAITWPWR